MDRAIKKSLISILLILWVSNMILHIQSLETTSYTEGNYGGGVGDPLNYKAQYDSYVNLLQGSGYAYAHCEQIPGSLGEAWAWFWLANYWTCKTSGTYEIVMQWRYNGEATLENNEFPFSASTSSAKALLHLFIESQNEISEQPRSTEVIFSEILNDVWKEEIFSIEGSTELRYKGYFKEGTTYLLRGELESIVFSRWIDGITWGSSTINLNGWLEKITILSDTYLVTTNITPTGSGYITGDGKYGLNEICELTAHAHENYEFDYWSGDIADKDNPTNFKVYKDANVIAYFKQKETIDFSIEVISSDNTKYKIADIVKLYTKIKNTGTKAILPNNAEVSFKIITPSGKYEDADISYNSNSLGNGDSEILEGYWRVPNNAEVGCYDIEVIIRVKEGPTQSDKISRAFCLDTCDHPKIKLLAPIINDLNVKIDGVTEPGCPNSSITHIHWDWGDGFEGYSTFPTSHTYERAGTFTIKITSYQNDGLFTRESVTVTLKNRDQLEIQILTPTRIVTSLPITFAAKVTCKGKPVPDAEVTFYQISPSSGFIGRTHSGTDGLGSHIIFQQLNPETIVSWFAVAKKTDFQDGISSTAVFIYQPLQLEVQILDPPNVVISTPINFTVKITCEGQPVPDVIVDFYQDFPLSEPMKFGVMTDHNGLASYTGFREEVPPDHRINWHVIARKWGYVEGRADGELLHQP